MHFLIISNTIQKEVDFFDVSDSQNPTDFCQIKKIETISCNVFIVIATFIPVVFVAQINGQQPNFFQILVFDQAVPLPDAGITKAHDPVVPPINKPAPEYFSATISH